MDLMHVQADRRELIGHVSKAAGLLVLVAAGCDGKQDEGLIARREAEGVDKTDAPGKVSDADGGSNLTQDQLSEGDVVSASPEHPMAKVLAYVEDATQSPLRNDPRYEIAAASQYCNNCKHFRPAGEVEGRQVGNCELIPTGRVEANGWCTAWLSDGVTR